MLDNCTLAPVRARGRGRADAERRALELLAELDLADKARAFPDALSGGQRQRVAIARALAVEPRVLLYDEPTSALDPSLKQEVGRTIRRLAGTGITQIVVTHDVDVAREATDVVFVLESGRVARSGPPAEVLAAWASGASPVATATPPDGSVTPRRPGTARTRAAALFTRSRALAQRVSPGVVIPHRCAAARSIEASALHAVLHAIGAPRLLPRRVRAPPAPPSSRRCRREA